METNGSPKFRVCQIDTGEIKFCVRRSRPSSAYARLKDSIKEIGLKVPISVRDVTSWTKSDRKRSDGGLYRFELICGQGRLQAFRELGIQKIPAVIHDVSEAEIVGRFLAANVMRKRLS